jgi:hypothetical protein
MVKAYLARMVKIIRQHPTSPPRVTADAMILKKTLPVKRNLRLFSTTEDTADMKSVSRTV